jgi:amphi-Trp domain-containing protein
MENAVSDVKVEQKQRLSRQEIARFIAALAEGLGDDGRVKVRLGNSTVELSVASQVDCEFEVAVDGDEVELELELKWSISGRPSAEKAQDGFDADEFGEDESPKGEAEEVKPQEGAAATDDVENAAAQDGAESDEPTEEVPGSSAGGSVPPTAPARQGRGRRSAAGGGGEPNSNGVDTAAVREWAAANGMPVSPRGRIKDEVLEAYRAAGN